MTALHIFLGVSAYVVLGVLTLILYTYVSVLVDDPGDDEDTMLVIILWPIVLLLSIGLFIAKAANTAHKYLVYLFRSLEGEHTMYQTMTAEQRIVTSHIQERNRLRGLSIVVIGDKANHDEALNHIQRLNRFGRYVRVLDLATDPYDHLETYCKSGGVEQVYIFGETNDAAPAILSDCKNLGIPCFIFKED